MHYTAAVPRSAVLFLALALCPPLLPAQADTDLRENASFQKGLAALADHLPDLAVAPLETALREFADNAAARNTIQIKLGEALVRAGRLEKEAAASHDRGTVALEHLERAAGSGHEQALFWSAQARILRAELGQAATLFAHLEKARDSELRNRSLVSRAHILVALGEPAQASALLDTFQPADQSLLSQEARLLRATVLIAQDELSEAGDLLTGDPEPSDRPQQIHMRYLRAQLIARNDKEKAVPLFRTIVEDPNPVPSLLRHSARVSLAGCLHETGKSEDAIETLITLLDTHPRTALLEAAFHRLLDWSSTESLRKRVDEQLLSWVSFSAPGDTPPEPGGGEIIVSPATATRTGFALYYHALSLARKNDTESNKRAESLLAWLGANMPRHPFCSRALLETAKLQIAGQRKEEAILTLAQLEKSASSARLREEAGRLAARLNFEKGDFGSAAAAFLRVSSSLPPPEEDVNAINAGISLLRAGDGTGFRNLVESLDASETRTTLLLERALHQVARESGDARPSLERFLRDRPEHPRVAEARLAIAEECLRLEPSSASAHRQIMAELNSLQAIPLSFQLDLRRLLVHLRAASLTSKWDPAITASREFLRKHKSNRMSTPVRLKLAEAYYHNGNLSDAQARFQEIAAAAVDPVIAETALYYAARAALKLNAGNSDQEAENLLRQVIDGGGSLATDARLLLAYSQIDGRPRETISNLQILLETENPAQLDARMLTADAYRELGESGDLQAALRIYDQILAQPDLAYPLSNRLFWLKGQVYEELGESRPALDAYYHVVRRDNLPDGKEPTEWYYFSRCAFDAVEILEQGSLPRWAASAAILRIVEDSGSPWRKEAGRRRAEIQLEHQLYQGE